MTCGVSNIAHGANMKIYPLHAPFPYIMDWVQWPFLFTCPRHSLHCKDHKLRHKTHIFRNCFPIYYTYLQPIPSFVWCHQCIVCCFSIYIQLFMKYWRVYTNLSCRLLVYSCVYDNSKMRLLCRLIGAKHFPLLK